jgi:purine nucleosidase
MRKKVIIDCDPGIDDAVALIMALFDPRLQVLAVTACGGNVPADQATCNLQSLVQLLDPSRLPKIGIASNDTVLPSRPFSLHGSDGLGGLNLPQTNLHGARSAEKVICETLREYPHEVTIIALGPLSNVSRAFSRDPSLVDLVHSIIISGGTVHAHGNATPVADFNFFCDPHAAQHIIHEPVAKTLVPLETSRQMVFGFDVLDQLPSESSRAGRILHKMLPHCFRAHRQLLGSEGIVMHDVVALVAATNAELFDRERVTADVEIAGNLTAGMLVLDRRHNKEAQSNADVLIDCDSTAVGDCVLRGLAIAGSQTESGYSN